MSTSPVASCCAMTGKRPEPSKRGRKSDVSSKLGAVDISCVGSERKSGRWRSDQIHEALLHHRIGSELAGELVGDGHHIALIYAAQRHALVNGFEHHRHAARLQRMIDDAGDL